MSGMPDEIKRNADSVELKSLDAEFLIDLIHQHTGTEKSKLARVPASIVVFAEQVAGSDANIFFKNHPDKARIAETGFFAFLAAYLLGPDNLSVHPGVVRLAVAKHFGFAEDTHPDFWNIDFCLGDTMITALEVAKWNGHWNELS